MKVRATIVVVLVVLAAACSGGTDSSDSASTTEAAKAHENTAVGAVGEIPVAKTLFTGLLTGGGEESGEALVGWGLSALGVSNGETQQVAEVQSQLNGISEQLTAISGEISALSAQFTAGECNLQSSGAATAIANIEAFNTDYQSLISAGADTTWPSILPYAYAFTEPGNLQTDVDTITNVLLGTGGQGSIAACSAEQAGSWTTPFAEATYYEQVHQYVNYFYDYQVLALQMILEGYHALAVCESTQPASGCADPGPASPGGIVPHRTTTTTAAPTTTTTAAPTTTTTSAPTTTTTAPVNPADVTATCPAPGQPPAPNPQVQTACVSASTWGNTLWSNVSDQILYAGAGYVEAVNPAFVTMAQKGGQNIWAQSVIAYTESGGGCTGASATNVCGLAENPAQSTVFNSGNAAGGYTGWTPATFELWSPLLNTATNGGTQVSAIMSDLGFTDTASLIITTPEVVTVNWPAEPMGHGSFSALGQCVFDTNFVAESGEDWPFCDTWGGQSLSALLDNYTDDGKQQVTASTGYDFSNPAYYQGQLNTTNWGGIWVWNLTSGPGWMVTGLEPESAASFLWPVLPIGSVVCTVTNSAGQVMAATTAAGEATMCGADMAAWLPTMLPPQPVAP